MPCHTAIWVLALLLAAGVGWVVGLVMGGAHVSARQRKAREPVPGPLERKALGEE